MTSDSTGPASFDVHAFALALVRPLCDEPGVVVVSAAEAETACVVTVAPSDFERLSSSRGRTLRSLATVLGAATAKQGTRCSLELRSGQ